MFSRTSATSSSLHIAFFTSNVLTVTNENHKRCIFPILPVNVPRPNYWYHKVLTWVDSFSLSIFRIQQNDIISNNKKEYIEQIW